jgi:C4-dicarboxylate-specific signal transduction histidine kinase
MGQLAASFAHELNQPLAASLTNAQSALRLLEAASPDVNEVRAALKDIAADNRRAGEIVNEMRRYLRKHELNVTIVNIPEFTSVIGQFLMPEARARAVELRFEVADSLPPVAIDRVQIQQVLVNLLLNAIEAVALEATSDRRVVVSAASTSEGRVGFKVSDSGPGVPMHLRERLFAPFVTTKVNGLGLGLAISHSIIAAHGGSLDYETGVLGGATFTFTIPAANGNRSRAGVDHAT